MKKIKKFFLKDIKGKKGNILKFISKKDKFFSKFGEIYFSEVNYRKTKGWNYHKKNKCHLSVISGRVKFHLLKKKNEKNFLSKKIIMSRKKYSMMIIPPKTFFSFKGLDKKNIIVNFMENSHDSNESLKFSKVKNIQIKD